MKKVILVVAIAGLAMSCKKIQAGGNKGVLKMEHDASRYSDDVVTDKSSADVVGAKDSASVPQTDSVRTANITEVQIKKDSAKVLPAAAEPAVSVK